MKPKFGVITFVHAVLSALIVGTGIGIIVAWYWWPNTGNADYTFSPIDAGGEDFRAGNQEVIDLVQETFPELQSLNEFLDETYYSTSLSTFTTFLQEDDLNQHVYIPEQFDCDDFALALKARAADKGITLGIVVIPNDEASHMVNFFIGKEGEKLVLYIVEPQTDEVRYPTTDDQKGWWVLF